MKKFSIGLINNGQLLLLLLTIIFAITIGVSFLVIPSSYAPLVILIGVMLFVFFVAWIKNPIWALYFAIFVILLPASLIPAQINSYINRIAIVIALVVWIIDVLRRRSRIYISTSSVLLVGFILWAAITLLWGEFFDLGIEILQRYILRLLLFLGLIVNEIRTRKDLNGLMNTLALSGGVLVLASIITILLQGYSSGERLQVLDVNQNELGILLILTLPGVIWWALQPTTGQISMLKRSVSVVFLLASIGLVGLSGSRGSAISLGIMLIGFLMWKSTQFWGILGLLFIGMAVIIAPIIFSTTISRFLGAPGETSLGGREYIWPVAWLLIKDHLLLGIGIGNSTYQIIPYLANAGIIRLSLLSVSNFSLHNPLLVIWAETGLPGLLLYLSILVSAVVSFIRQYINNKNMREEFLLPYFALISSMFIGYMASWIKGGGMESGTSYFLVLALLIIPSQIQLEKLKNS